MKGNSDATAVLAMKVSVITVVRNNAETIEETIRSVAAQDYRGIEHIIVDGCSTDGTTDVIKRHLATVTTYISEPDKGIYDAMNKGIRLATGDVVGFLNADDVYVHSGVIARVVEVIQGASAEACYADLVYVSPDDPKRVVRYWKSRPYEDGLFENGWMPAHPTFFANRAVYERLGGFDLAFKRQADFELTMRFLAVHKIPSVYIPELLVRMRTGGLSNNSLSGIWKGNIEAYRACKKHNLPITPLFIARKLISRLPQFFTRPRIRSDSGILS